jgi:hypothetical protein
VENTEEADIGAEVLGIARHLDGGRRPGTERRIVKEALVLQRQNVEFTGRCLPHSTGFQLRT